MKNSIKIEWKLNTGFYEDTLTTKKAILKEAEEAGINKFEIAKIEEFKNGEYEITFNNGANDFIQFDKNQKNEEAEKEARKIKEAKIMDSTDYLRLTIIIKSIELKKIGKNAKLDESKIYWLKEAQEALLKEDKADFKHCVKQYNLKMTTNSIQS